MSERRTNKPEPMKRAQRAPARTPEGREMKITSAIYDLVEEQIRDKTVSSQVMTHFLKESTERAKLEKFKLQKEVELLEKRAQAADSAANMEALYSEAIKALQTYRGERPPDPTVLHD